MSQNFMRSKTHHGYFYTLYRNWIITSSHIKIKILHAQCFMNDCPDGRMSKEKMKEMFATTVAKSKVISFWSSLLKSASIRNQSKDVIVKCRP